MKKLYFLLLTMFVTLGMSAQTVTDVLNQSLIGITGTAYTDFTCSGTSGTAYAGQCAGDKASIQLRSKNNNSGVVSTTSIGYAKKVVVKWQQDTNSKRVLNVYGSNAPYAAATDLYDAATQGDLLGTIARADGTELEISGSYAYIGFRSADGAMYLEEVSITWEIPEAGTVAAPSINPMGGLFYGAKEVTMSAADGCTIHYTINEGAEQTYAEPFTLSEAGKYAISAYAKNADGKTSDATTAEIEIKEIVNYTSIADMRAACTATSSNTAPVVDFTFTDLLITGVNGSGLYVTDGTNSYYIYGKNSLEPAKGDKISGTIRGQLYLYNGLGELAATDNLANVTKASTGNEVTPVVAAITDVIDEYATYEAAYVQLQNVKFAAEKVDGRNIKIANAAGDEITIYDTANLLGETTFLTDKEYNVNCYVVRYKETVQVYVLDVNDIQVITDLEIPESAWSVEEVSLLVGETSDAKFTTTSDGAVTYTSSAEGIASVSADGTITAVAAGTCTITAETAETAKFLASSEVVKVTVKEVMGGLETFVNGGFEDWASDSQPIGWKSATTASNATLEKSTDSHSGEYSVLVKNATSNKRLGSKEFLMPEGWYTIEFYAKSATETPAQARPGYAPWDEEGGKLGQYVYGDYTENLSNTEWTLVKFVFELTEETQLNLVVMNPASKDGKTYGDLLVDDFVFRAATDVETGINGAVVEKADGACFNLAGQKVDDSFKGIVIKNGKKFIRK